MRAIDTNLVVRIFARDNVAQSRIVDEFIQVGAWISHLVLAEAVWVFQSVYKAKRADVAKAIESLVSHESLALENGEVIRDALVLFVRNTKLSFSDCMILEIARKAGHTPLGTFDNALGKVAGAKSL